MPMLSALDFILEGKRVDALGRHIPSQAFDMSTVIYIDWKPRADCSLKTLTTERSFADRSGLAKEKTDPLLSQNRDGSASEI